MVQKVLLLCKSCSGVILENYFKDLRTELEKNRENHFDEEQSPLICFELTIQ
jgi:hypothetical protein